MTTPLHGMCMVLAIIGVSALVRPVIHVRRQARSLSAWRRRAAPTGDYRSEGGIATVLRRATALALLASGSAVLAHATPLIRPVQFIQVCDPILAGGSACPWTDADVALDGANSLLKMSLDTANRIFEQADMRVVSAGPVKRLNLAGAAEIDIVSRNQIPTDEARFLMRGPHLSSVQTSPNDTTINVFLVGATYQVDLDGNRLGEVLGYGFIGANGVTLSRRSAADTLAHEFAHNLGLPHPAAGDTGFDSGNLMYSAESGGPPRLHATGPDDARIGTSVDIVTLGQRERLREAIFANDFARLSRSFPDDLEPPGPQPAVDIPFHMYFAASAPARRVTQITVNFLPGSDPIGFEDSNAFVQENLRELPAPCRRATFDHVACSEAIRSLPRPTVRGVPAQGPSILFPDRLNGGTKQIIYDVTVLWDGGFVPGNYFSTFFGDAPLSAFLTFDDGSTLGIGAGDDLDPNVEQHFLIAGGPENGTAFGELFPEDLEPVVKDVPEPAHIGLFAFVVLLFLHSRRPMRSQ